MGGPVCGAAEIKIGRVVGTTPETAPCAIVLQREAMLSPFTPRAGRHAQPVVHADTTSDSNTPIAPSRT